ncbi:MAG: conserved phage C-terminal domain-containing protein, partial [Verrucomicrobiota bacterium]
ITIVHWAAYQESDQPLASPRPAPDQSLTGEQPPVGQRTPGDSTTTDSSLTTKQEWKNDKKGRITYLVGLAPDDAQGESPPDSANPTGQQQLEFAREILAYLNQKADRKFQCVAVHLDAVRKRLNEVGWDVPGVKAMIDRMCAKWKTDEQMADYLRPHTLFNRTKFRTYYDDRDQPVATPTRVLDRGVVAEAIDSQKADSADGEIPPEKHDDAAGPAPLRLPEFAPLPAPLFASTGRQMLEALDQMLKPVVNNDAYWVKELAKDVAEVIDFVSQKNEPTAQARVKELRSDPRNWRKARLRPDAEAFVEAIKRRKIVVQRAMAGLKADAEPPVRTNRSLRGDALQPSRMVMPIQSSHATPAPHHRSNGHLHQGACAAHP